MAQLLSPEGDCIVWINNIKTPPINTIALTQKRSTVTRYENVSKNSLQALN